MGGEVGVSHGISGCFVAIEVIVIIVYCTSRKEEIQTSVMQILAAWEREDEVGRSVAAFVKLAVTPVRIFLGFSAGGKP